MCHADGDNQNGFPMDNPHDPKHMTQQKLEQLLDIITQRIVQSSNPIKIILFGSCARGEMGPNSDIDLMVVVPNGTHRRNTARRIYRAMIGVGFAVDVVVVNEDDLIQFKDNQNVIIKPAQEEGRLLYVA